MNSQSLFWEQMKGKYEEKNASLQQRELELRHRIEAMQTLMGGPCAAMQEGSSIPPVSKLNLFADNCSCETGKGEKKASQPSQYSGGFLKCLQCFFSKKPIADAPPPLPPAPSEPPQTSTKDEKKSIDSSPCINDTSTDTKSTASAQSDLSKEKTKACFCKPCILEEMKLATGLETGDSTTCSECRCADSFISKISKKSGSQETKSAKLCDSNSTGKNGSAAGEGVGVRAASINEDKSMFSLKSADLFYMANLQNLVNQERTLICQINDLEQRERAYQEVLKEFKGTEARGGDCQCNRENPERKLAEMKIENTLLKNELKDMRLEVKHYLEKMEGPMVYKIESEKYKRLQLEDELEQSNRKLSDLKDTCQQEIYSVKMELCAASATNCKLKQTNEELTSCVQCCQHKINQLEDDLIRQKLSDAEMIKKLQNSLEECKRLAAKRDSCNLNDIARELSNMLKVSGPCEECAAVPSDFITTVQGVRDLTDMVYNKMPQKEDKGGVSEESDASHKAYDTPQTKSAGEILFVETEIDATLKSKSVSSSVKADIASQETSADEAATAIVQSPASSKPFSASSSAEKKSVISEEQRASKQPSKASRVSANVQSPTSFKALSAASSSAEKKSAISEGQRSSKQPSKASRLSGLQQPDVEVAEKLSFSGSESELPTSLDAERKKKREEVKKPKETLESCRCAQKKAESKKKEEEEKKGKCKCYQKKKEKSPEPLAESKIKMPPCKCGLKKKKDEENPDELPICKCIKRKGQGEGLSPDNQYAKSLRCKCGQKKPPIEVKHEAEPIEVKHEAERIEVKHEAEPIAEKHESKSVKSEKEDGIDQIWPTTSERLKVKHEVTASQSQDFLKSTTSVKALKDKENFPFDVDTQVDIIDKPPDGVHVTTTITKSGMLEVITEGPEGVIETTLVYTDSGNVEVVTEILDYKSTTSKSNINKLKALPGGGIHSEDDTSVAGPYSKMRPDKCVDTERKRKCKLPDEFAPSEIKASSIRRPNCHCVDCQGGGGTAEASEVASIKSKDVESIKSRDVGSIKSKDMGSIKSKEVASIKSKDAESIKSKDVVSIKSKDMASIKSKDAESIKSKDVASIKSKEVASSKSKDMASIKSKDVESMKSKDAESIKSKDVVSLKSGGTKSIQEKLEQINEMAEEDQRNVSDGGGSKFSSKKSVVSAQKSISMSAHVENADDDIIMTVENKISSIDNVDTEE